MFTRSYLRYVLIASAIVAFPMRHSHAQIDHDPTNHAYFVNGSAVVSSDISGHDVFVGKTDATGFVTLSNPAELVITSGAVIDRYVASYPVGDPTAPLYAGINVFGSSRVNMQGGSVYEVYNHDAGRVNISGGTVYVTSSYGASITNITGGSVEAAATAGDNSTLNISGGLLQNASGGRNSTLNIGGGTVFYTNIFESSSLNVTGGQMTGVNGSFNTAIRVSGGNIFRLEGRGGTTAISGGVVSFFRNDYSGVADITGGTFTGLQSLGNSVINLYGTGLALSGGIAGQDGSGQFIRYTLSGVLAGGQSANGVTFTDYLGGYDITNPAQPNGPRSPLNLITVPEPATPLLTLSVVPLLGAGLVRRIKVPALQVRISRA